MMAAVQRCKQKFDQFSRRIPTPMFPFSLYGLHFPFSNNAGNPTYMSLTFNHFYQLRKLSGAIKYYLTLYKLY